MKKTIRMIALVLSVLLLAGCAGQPAGDAVHYRDMEYVRPDLARMEHLLSLAADAAMAEEYGGQLQDVLSAIYAFYDEYDRFYTNYALADLKTSHDLTDIYWEQEYAWCLEHSSDAEALLEELYRQLARSSCREDLEAEAYFGADFFSYYDGDSTYDEGFLALLEREAELQSEYYDLSARGAEYDPGSEAFYSACGDEMIELLVSLIALRQEIAAYWGYEDYPTFANDFYYYRDYTPRQTRIYLQDIAEHLVPIYRELDWESLWALSDRYSGEDQTLAFVRGAAKNMGGMVWEAFSLMESAGLYDIEYSLSKYDASFEIYLPSYYQPFVFLNPELTRYDCLTLAHEFGHFCNDHACFGSYSGVDVSEVFSQGMEYLSLCYGEDTEDLTGIKLADSLSLFVEQAAFARFELQMYSLEGSDLSAEGLCRLYAGLAEEYGFDSVGYDPREFAVITHLYTNPMYIQSYIFSNDAAMQLYQLEQADAGAGLQLYMDNLTSQEPWFLAFLEGAGLESPFAPGRVETLADTFRQLLK